MRGRNEKEIVEHNISDGDIMFCTAELLIIPLFFQIPSMVETTGPSSFMNSIRNPWWLGSFRPPTRQVGKQATGGLAQLLLTSKKCSNFPDLDTSSA
jgi:hypothetical protein